MLALGEAAAAQAVLDSFAPRPFSMRPSRQVRLAFVHRELLLGSDLLHWQLPAGHALDGIIACAVPTVMLNRTYAC